MYVHDDRSLTKFDQAEAVIQFYKKKVLVKNSHNSNYQRRLTID